MSDGQTLSSYKKSAKRLKKAFSAGEPDAVARVRSVIAEDRPLKHADFLHVVAREIGHDSWPKLKFALERSAMSREERAERLKMALYHGQHWVTEKLLDAEPDLKDDNLGLQIALYDAASVRRALDQTPAAATNTIGIRTPLLHLAFSKEIHRSPHKAADMIEIAERLVRNGAGVNEGYPAEPGGGHKLSALYGALCHASNHELGKWLLEQGADPNDNESLYHSTELGNTRALELLLAHGARPSGTNALPRALDFRNTEMVRLLLEAGADPNEAVRDHPSGQPIDTIPALHQAARRWCSAEQAELLLKHGADPLCVWNGHTPYATARIFGNRDIAEVLEKHGAATPLSQVEQLLASCASGQPGASGLDVGRLHEEDRRLLTRIVFQEGRLDHLKALVAAGLDPNQADEMGLPPLHAAGWAGLPETVAYLLTLGPDLTWKNAFGGDALDTVLHGSEHRLDREERDHISCARLLLKAGSVIYPDFITGCGNEEMVAFLEEWAADNPQSLVER
ncbi:ankyrin repeat domain-containing protein [Roseibium denhamense]|uniref:Ankyrin repeat n=1 Tax=Roseibium denhamense TaxID=76305 RepID=A0ABY1P5B7_9HYPH|nr:ankyrin repeat domain-containing protein [Roseibium denhamense]MTI05167.1 ankyrin repeat domain-containing protein [Roseibium denhamense]SMP25888.1 Ankyrin repeat [Roseibium denhamense]